MRSCIYDFETLSQDAFNGVVVNIALLVFDEGRFVNEPYDFLELVNDCTLIKFDVEEQVKKYGRKIQQSTLEWWSKQNKTAQKMLAPSSDDVSIECLYDVLYNDIKLQTCDRVYTRGNTFDPVFLKSVLRHFDKEDPSKWWNIRDTRSLFDGMLWGTNMDSKFIPPGLKDLFIPHDPCHDIAMDVMRFQTLVRELSDDI